MAWPLALQHTINSLASSASRFDNIFWSISLHQGLLVSLTNLVSADRSAQCLLDHTCQGDAVLIFKLGHDQTRHSANTFFFISIDTKMDFEE